MIATMKRPCHGCEVFDDHPRHEIIDPESGSDALGGPMHMDCCAKKRGCQVCKLQLQRASETSTGRVVKSGELIGQKLRNALVELPPIQVVHADGNLFSVAEAWEV
jgi:hypothetical protein